MSLCLLVKKERKKIKGKNLSISREWGCVRENFDKITKKNKKREREFGHNWPLRFPVRRLVLCVYRPTLTAAQKKTRRRN